MNVVSTMLVVVSCILVGHVEPACLAPQKTVGVAEEQLIGPQRSPEALDVELTAKAAIVWDVESDKTLYALEETTQRPVASLSKLLSVLVVRKALAAETVVPIPPQARVAQRQGAHIRLPVGDQARVESLLAASLIASANDALVSLAVATAGTEDAFVERAHEVAAALGLRSTHLANATGLPGGVQYSTADDVRRLLMLVYADPLLQPYLDDERGSLTTQAGIVRQYESTNELLATYLPVIAAKTGYTVEAGENVALLTRVGNNHVIGIVILGSRQRFQDAKILAEWINRHYTWTP